MNLWFFVSLAVTILLFLGACMGVRAVLEWMALREPFNQAAKIILGIIAIVIIICFFTGSVPLIPLGGYHNGRLT